MTDRFDLEQYIMSCWNVIEDIETVLELVQDNDRAMNALLGLKEIYSVKFNKLQEAFENVIASRSI